MKRSKLPSIKLLFVVLCFVGIIIIFTFNTYVIPNPEYVDRNVPAHYGYLSFGRRQPLRLHCKTCSLVFGSGHLNNSNKGEEIDSRDCVIRSNVAPTTGYEKDVGKRTTVRCVTKKTYQMALRSLLYTSFFDQPAFDPEYKENTIILKSGIQHFIENQIALLFYPYLQLYLVEESRFNKVFKIFKSINNDPIRMSSGFIIINYARDFCDELHVYGVPDEYVCDKVKAGQQKDVSYHYYDDGDKETHMMKECGLYEFKVAAKDYGHDFIQEKKMFRQWLTNPTFNIHFHAPEWFENTKS